jgi:glycosyltransferase involved in cell wall biosynthesis
MDVAPVWLSARMPTDEQAAALPTKGSLLERMVLLAAARLNKWESASAYISSRTCAALLSKRARECSANIINLHNIHEAADNAFLDALGLSEIPVVWTLHDMWPLTGYCCYAGECRKYCTGCTGLCPEAGRWGHARVTAEAGWKMRDAWIRKRGKNMCFVAPSLWLANIARARFADSVAVHHIPNGVSLEVFRPLSQRMHLRYGLGLEPDGRILLFVASVLGDTRKGWQSLAAALSGLSSRYGSKLRVVCVGNGKLKTDATAVQTVNAIHDERLLNLYYNTADLVVHPAAQDNLPNTLLEALAAGTPSVAFTVGGCSDIVRDGVTGRLLGKADPQALSQGIADMLDMPVERMAEMRAKCRAVAENEYGSQLQAKRYISLFQDMITFSQSTS